MKKIMLLLLAVFAWTGVLLADNLDFTVNGSPYDATGFGGYYYISPYYAHDNTTGNNLTMFCLDFDHEINTPENYDANIHAIPGSSTSFSGVANQFQFGAVTDLSNFADTYGVLTGASIYQRYEAAVWLVSHEMAELNALGGAAVNSFAGHQIRAKYQYAAWELFVYQGSDSAMLASSLAAVGANAYGSSFGADVGSELTAAITAAKNGAVSLVGWAVVSPVPVGQPNSLQEFLSPVSSADVAPVPEPSAILMLGTVGLAIGALLFRRRQSV